jgi:hypothetical protein
MPEVVNMPEPDPEPEPASPSSYIRIPTSIRVETDERGQEHLVVEYVSTESEPK